MYHFIINPKSSSGKGIRYWWVVKDELDKREIPYTAVFTKHMGHAITLAETICNENEGTKNIIVLGGDGTVNEVINGIPDLTEVLLGYIPSGSSNDLARSLKIPKDPIVALDNILNPKRFQYLDHGVIAFPDSDIKDRRFACSSGIGYDASVCVEVMSSPLKKRLNRFGAGKFVYIAIAIKQLITLKRLTATIIVDGMKKETYQRVLFMSGMIHKYEGGGVMMAPAADPCDGKLSICLAHSMGTMKSFSLMPTTYSGKHVNFKGVESFNCSEIEIFLDQDAAVHTDGEVPAICKHIKVSCHQGQIRMIL